MLYDLINYHLLVNYVIGNSNNCCSIVLIMFIFMIVIFIYQMGS